MHSPSVACGGLQPLAAACAGCVHTQGLYDSIKDASVLKLPIYITEIGLADKEDKYRGQYIKDLYAMVGGGGWWALQVWAASFIGDVSGVGCSAEQRDGVMGVACGW